MLLSVNGVGASVPIETYVKPTIYHVVFTAAYVDRYDRRIFTKNGRKYYFYFTTSYKVMNKPVSAETFWRKSLKDKTFQAKVSKEGSFWFVQQINIAN